MKHLTLPVEVREGDGRTVKHQAWLWNEVWDCVAYADAFTLPKLREGLTDRVMGILTEADSNQRNNRRAVVGCGDGTVLLVEWRYGGYGYSIINQTSRSSASGGGTYEEWIERAKQHAEESYGGCVWSHAL